MTELMTLARKIQQEADAMLPSLTETGELDLEVIGRMEKLRHEIITTTSEGPMDTLMQFGCVRSVAGFLLGVAQSGPDDLPAAIQLVEWGLLEMLIGLNAIRPKLESDAGASLKDLGLFQDKGTLQ